MSEDKGQAEQTAHTTQATGCNQVLQHGHLPTHGVSNLETDTSKVYQTK